MQVPLNVLGKPLEVCSLKPLTGYYRDGACNSRSDNPGYHAVCIYASEEFLEYSKKVGNDLSTPMPQYNFTGVKAGQCWCLSGPRFVQAVKDNMAPKIRKLKRMANIRGSLSFISKKLTSGNIK